MERIWRQKKRAHYINISISILKFGVRVHFGEELPGLSGSLRVSVFLDFIVCIGTFGA